MSQDRKNNPFVAALGSALRRPTARSRTAIALLLGAVVVWPLYAQGAHDATALAEVRVRAALGESTDLELADTPLADALSFLSDRHNILIKLDEKALEEAGVGTDTPIRARLKEISLKSALALMLEPLKLAPVVHEGVLLVTTEDMAENMHKVRVYFAGDLLGGDPDALVQAITASIARDRWSETGGLGSILLFDELLVVGQTDSVHEQIERLLGDLRAAKAAERVEVPRRAKADETPADSEGMVVRTYTLGGQGASDDFADLVRTIVAPGSWAENGGEGSIRRVGPLQFADGSTLGGALIVRQTPEVHAQLDRFLDQLKGLATPMRFPKPVAGGFGGGGFGLQGGIAPPRFPAPPQGGGAAKGGPGKRPAE